MVFGFSRRVAEPPRCLTNDDVSRLSRDVSALGEVDLAHVRGCSRCRTALQVAVDIGLTQIAMAPVR